MKGFIEVHNEQGHPFLLNVSLIEYILDGQIHTTVATKSGYSVSETYSEILAKIEEAQREDKYCVKVEPFVEDN